jgi:type IV fimbrial biogenesis protein FimT
MSNAFKGFTLIELMMTLSLAAILLTLAVPSYITFTQNSRITTQTNKLIAAVSHARGEAAKRGVRVVMCQSDDPAAATPACDGTTGTWTNGWVVFVDTDNDLTVDASTDVIASFRAESGVNLLTDAGKTIAFNADGTTTVNDSVKFGICDSRGKDHGNEITIAPTGRASSQDATTCTP